MIKLTPLVTAATLLMLTACSAPEADNQVDKAPPAMTESAQLVIQQAQAKYQLAQHQQHAWTVTGRLLDTARAALASNDEAAALNAAQRALATAEASLVQGEQEQQAWQARVPH